MLQHNQGVAEIVFVKLEPLAHELHIKNADAKTDTSIDLHVIKVRYCIDICDRRNTRSAI